MVRGGSRTQNNKNNSSTIIQGAKRKSVEDLTQQPSPCKLCKGKQIRKETKPIDRCFKRVLDKEIRKENEERDRVANPKPVKI